MPCGVHFAYHDNCRPCRDAESRADADQRHYERMRQADRHHRDNARARDRQRFNRDATSHVANLTRTSLGLGGIVSAGLPVLLLLVAVVLAVATIAITVFGAVLHALITGVVIGLLAGAVTYAVKRHEDPDSKPRYAVNTTLPLKQRASSFYRSLDPVTGSAVKVGTITAVAAFVLTILL